MTIIRTNHLGNHEGKPNVDRIVNTKTDGKDDIDTRYNVDGDVPEVEEAHDVCEGDDDNADDDDCNDNADDGHQDEDEEDYNEMTTIWKIMMTMIIKPKVTCSPDLKGNFGSVTETFTVGSKSVKVILFLMILVLILIY